MTAPDAAELISLGVEGLDSILGGGVTRNRTYLLEGHPGSGKTTLALQFLLAGAARGERTMYVTLSESAEELRGIAQSHGWTMDGIDVVELLSSETSLQPDASYVMFHPSEVELSVTTQAVLREAERLKPARLVFDSLSEFRLLAQNPLRYRRQIMVLKQFFSRQQCTGLFVDDRTNQDPEMHLFSLVTGVISLEQRTTEYGSLRRQLQVVKTRGRAFREGWHDMRIVRGGIQVYPRLVSSEHRGEYSRDPVLSGLAGLDALVGGGLEPGTSTLILGPAGTGKSTLASQYAAAAAQRGDVVAVFLFEELRDTYLKRSEGLGVQLTPLIDSGRLLVRQIDPAELSPGEFTQAVRDAVEHNGAHMVVIDTVNGYLNAMPSEKLLSIHLHELLTYLGQKGVSTILVTAQHGVMGSDITAPIDTTYLADAVFLLRFFEAEGSIRQAISVVKKRTGPHERTIRELKFTNSRLSVGEPLTGFRGILGGSPVPIAEPDRTDRDGG